jgi:tight adherence protein B
MTGGGKDTTALLLLLGVIVVALVGLWLLFTTSARRAELAGDAGWEQDAGRRVVATVDQRLRRTAAGERYATGLRAAGVPVAPAEFLLIQAGAVLVLWLAGQLFLSGLAALVVALVLTVLGARTYVARRRTARRDAFISQLPELARVLSNGTQAGLSLAGAVQLAARELEDPAGAEMRTVLDELRVGRALEDSLEGLRERLPSREVAVLMTTLVIQQRAGGDTVRALQELGSTLDARKDLIREIRTLLSGAVYTSYVVAGIGVGTIVLMNVITPGVLREMTSGAIGLIAIAVAGVLWAVAFVLIRQTTRVDV